MEREANSINRKDNMEEKNLNEVVENATTEQPKAEPTPKTYTEDEVTKVVNEKVNAILPSKIERARAKVEKEYREKYGKTEEIIKAGLGVATLEEATTQLSEFYKEKGVTLPTEPHLTARQIEVLAKADAEEVIQAGYDEIVEEVERLAHKGTDKMSDLEKKVYIRLAQARKEKETAIELEKIGVGTEILESDDFKKFRSKLNPELTIKECYELYTEFKPKEKPEKIGSQTTIPEKTTKEFYTAEEAKALTKAELDDPTIFKNVMNSMYKGWKR